MAMPSTAVEHYQQQQQIAAAAAQNAGQLWGTMTDEFDASYAAISSDLFASTISAQLQAAQSGVLYAPAVLDQQGIDATQVALIDPSRFQGGTPDGRGLEGLLRGAVYTAKGKVKEGAAVQAALTFAGAWLQRTVLDVVRDADRQAVQGTLATTKVVTSWTRMLNPPSCRFCIMLAGKVYRWNQGFRAHRGCDCRHVPTRETIGGELTLDPYAYFRSLSTRDQDRTFGVNDAQAVRDGGDIYRIVNTRFRGLADDAGKVGGARSSWQARRFGTPSKMTVDEVYAAANGSRERAVQLLEKNGFITGPQVGGGNIVGNAPGGQFGDLAAGAAGRGGERKGATLAYRRAAASGTRDPLEPATQTAAEKRLYAAVLRKRALDAGRNPFVASRPVTAQVRGLIERDYARQLAEVDDALEIGNSQLAELARLLGVRR